MKYITIIDTDDFEDFEFFEDNNGKYLHGIDACSVNGGWMPLYFTECEQESTLDDLRAEIGQMDFDFGDFYDHTSTIREMVLEVIDKHKPKSKETYNSDGWCNTCAYKHLESECLSCAKYDEYDNLIALSNYEKESE